MPDFPPELDQYLQPEASPPPPPDPEVAVCAAIRPLLDAKYAVLLAYLVYGSSLRFPERDGLYEHFFTHADDEKKWIYELHRMLSARGEEHAPTGVSIPAPPMTAARPALEALLQLESATYQGWVALNEAVSSDPSSLGASGFAQDGARATLAHLEDLRRYLGGSP